MSRNVEKKISELAAWDLNKGCRKFINQHSPSNRRLKKIIRKADRKRIDNKMNEWYNKDVEGSNEDGKDDLV